MSKKMKTTFIVYRSRTEFFVTTPKLEKEFLKERGFKKKDDGQGCRVLDEYDREEVPYTHLQIETSVQY